jgi:hypothetical protein
MLLNEFLKEHRKVEALERKTHAQERNAHNQEAMMAQMKKQIEVLTTGLRKVSDQLEISKAAPQLVVSDQ